MMLKLLKYVSTEETIVKTKAKEAKDRENYTGYSIYNAELDTIDKLKRKIEELLQEEEDEYDEI